MAQEVGISVSSGTRTVKREYKDLQSSAVLKSEFQRVVEEAINEYRLVERSLNEVGELPLGNAEAATIQFQSFSRILEAG